MSFVFPTFLYALFAILIPVIIHLFNFRKYKKIYFTNVKFLRELKQESQSKSRLKEILILISRILAISALVFAFAQPVLVNDTTKVKTGNKAIGVYIDNSFSMEGVNKNGSLLENAKKRAKEIVAAFGNADKFMLLTNDFEGKHQRFFSKEEINEAIDEVKISSAVKSLSSVIKRQQDFLRGAKLNDMRSFVISDFQKSISDFKNFPNDTAIINSLIAVNANTSDNVYIDTCWFDSPVQQKGVVQKLNIRIYNKSNKAIENGTIRLTINNKQTGIASFNAEAQSKTETQLTFECKEEGFNFCSLKLDDYPITFDDELFFTFNSKLNIQALVINGKSSETGSYFKSLMQSDSLFSFYENNELSIDYGLFAKANLIILNEVENFSSGLISEINKYMQVGGHLVLIPAKKMEASSYSQFYKALSLPAPGNTDTTTLKVEKTDFKTGFYEGVFDKIDERIDLPVIKKRFLTNLSSRSNLKPILKLMNGETWLGELDYNSSKLYLFSGPLDVASSNFCKHALFVPTIYKMAINSLKAVPPYYYTQNNSVIQINAISNKGDEPFHLKSLNNKSDVIPEIRVGNNRLNIFTQGQIVEPGFYNLTLQTQTLQALAFNFNRLESGLEFYTNDEMEKNLGENHLVSYKTIIAGEKTLTSSVAGISGNTKLWKLFVILTLIFVAIEIALIRFLK
ncbi:MAG: BatA and WFA domain-containing protein [Bacteroidia bacterium]|nr:BatA and WFA domain-containing protein [Bacteroidia bacterium]